MERKDDEAREKDLAAWAEKLKADHSASPRQTFSALLLT